MMKLTSKFIQILTKLNYAVFVFNFFNLHELIKIIYNELT